MGRGWMGCVAAAVVLATGCQTARMSVDPVLKAATEAWVVQGHNPRTWNRPLRFGPFQTAQVREGATGSWLLNVFGVGIGSARQPYRFTMVGPDHTVMTECFAQARQIGWGGLVVELAHGSQPILVCGIGEDLQGNRWVLSLARREAGLAGEVRRTPDGSGPGMSVVSNHNLEGSRLAQVDPVGYHILVDGRVVAGVETINAGRVWMTPQAAPGRQEVVAAVVTALLLFRPPEAL